MVVIAVVVVAVDVVAEGVGAEGALAFCLGRPGSNSGSDLGFFSSELLSIFSHWVLDFF